MTESSPFPPVRRLRSPVQKVHPGYRTAARLEKAVGAQTGEEQVPVYRYQCTVNRRHKLSGDRI